MTNDKINDLEANLQVRKQLLINIISEIASLITKILIHLGEISESISVELHNELVDQLSILRNANANLNHAIHEKLERELI
jgi:hypothetical protein